MRSRKVNIIMYASFLGILLLTLFICGKQIMDSTQEVAEMHNDHYAEITELQKALKHD